MDLLGDHVVGGGGDIGADRRPGVAWPGALLRLRLGRLRVQQLRLCIERL
jgi:hypothetical protein